MIRLLVCLTFVMSIATFILSVLAVVNAELLREEYKKKLEDKINGSNQEQ